MGRFHAFHSLVSHSISFLNQVAVHIQFLACTTAFNLIFLAFSCPMHCLYIWRERTSDREEVEWRQRIMLRLDAKLRIFRWLNINDEMNRFPVFLLRLKTRNWNRSIFIIDFHLATVNRDTPFDWSNISITCFCLCVCAISTAASKWWLFHSKRAKINFLAIYSALTQRPRLQG